MAKRKQSSMRDLAPELGTEETEAASLPRSPGGVMFGDFGPWDASATHVTKRPIPDDYTLGSAPSGTE